MSKIFRVIPPEELLEPEAFTAASPSAGLPGGWTMPGDHEAIKPTQWLIADILPAESYAVLYGSGESFKSAIALDMGLSIAAGIPWQGRATMKVPVLYIAAERKWLQDQRAAVWMHHHSFEAGQVMCPIAPWAGSMRSPADVDELIATIRRGFRFAMPGLIVVDGLTTTWGASTNADSMWERHHMEAYNAGIRRLQKATGATVLVIHHANKRGGMAESMALRDAVDTQIHAKHNKRAGTITLSCAKQSAAPHFKPFALRPRDEILRLPDGTIISAPLLSADDQPDKAGQPKPDPHPKPTAAQLSPEHREALRVLAKAGPDGMPLDRLEAVLGISEATRKRLVQGLTQHRLVERVGTASGGRGRRVKLRLTSAGLQAAQKRCT